MGKYYFPWDGGELDEVPKEEAVEGGHFFYAPTPEAIREAGVEFVERGECIGYTALDEIQMGVRTHFQAGDPWVFWGTPLKKVTRVAMNG